MFETPPPKYPADALLKIMLQEDIPSERICSERPILIDRSATYLIDITKLQHPDDVKNDAFGKWEHLGSHNTLFRTWKNDDGDFQAEKCSPGASGQNVFHLRRLYSRHPSNSECRRILAFVTGQPYTKLNITIIIFLCHYRQSKQSASFMCGCLLFAGWFQASSISTWECKVVKTISSNLTKYKRPH